jgi:hypothetical protein
VNGSEEEALTSREREDLWFGDPGRAGRPKNIHEEYSEPVEDEDGVR